MVQIKLYILINKLFSYRLNIDINMKRLSWVDGVRLNTVYLRKIPP